MINEYTISTFEEYQKLAMRTAAHLLNDRRKGFIASVLGLIGEGGEVVDEVKKVYAQNHTISREKIVKETGDLFWYFALLFEALKGTGFELNLNKIRAFKYFGYVQSEILVKHSLAIGEVNGEMARFASEQLDYTELTLTSQDIVYLRRNITHLYRAVNSILAELNISVQDVWIANIVKLRERYPEGFKTELSQNRKAGDE